MQSIKEQVESLVKTHQTSDPWELCDFLNVTVLEVPLHPKMHGFFINVSGEEFIYVNEQQSPQEKRVTIAHELGHLLLHPTLNSLFMMQKTFARPSRYEREADLFACHLLLPDDLFQSGGFGGETLEKISQETGVPLRFVEMKWESLPMRGRMSF
jgi:Zn-dependent peptidase ImmA (M78 family)